MDLPAESTISREDSDAAEVTIVFSIPLLHPFHSCKKALHELLRNLELEYWYWSHEHGTALEIYFDGSLDEEEQWKAVRPLEDAGFIAIGSPPALSSRPLPDPAPAIASPPAHGFPRFWELFPILLPRSVRERIYDPCHEELKEDYLRERARWTGRSYRRWVTFCFTIRTLGLVGQSLWAAAGGAIRRLAIGVVMLVLGEQTVAAIRKKIAGWFGRLP